jgi:sensor histidine kinase YesM
VKEFCRENWKSIIWLIIAAFATTAFWAPPWETPLNVYFRLGGFMAILWVFLWLGNSQSADIISKRISWTERPVLRLAVGMLVMVVYTVLVVVVLVWIYNVLLHFRITVDEVVWSSLIITFVISTFMHGRGFLSSWRQAELNAIELQKESVRAQYDSLKNQVNPHFLFNSLNALTNLIYDDQDKAAKFVKQLSEVYRYVLDTQDRELVPLSEELKFLGSYLFLQQIRFGDKLKVELNISNSETKVAPLVLQMLVENAIKHNIISNDQPLTIKIYNEGDSVVIMNNLQKKTVIAEESKGIGLQNIKKRYSFLSKQEVLVSDAAGSFVVKLPLIISQ